MLVSNQLDGAYFLVLN